ncbi:MAG: thioredoxin domain-containing protein [Desulfotignum sp.]
MIVLKALTVGSFLSSDRMLRFLPVLVLLYLACLLFVTAIFPGPGQADVPAQSVEQTSGQKTGSAPELDGTALKAGIAQRIRMSRGAKDDRYKQFSPDLVKIDEKIFVHLRGMDFFAVKIILHHPDTKAVEEVLSLIVDKTGTLQISGVHDLSSGANLTQNAVSRLQHVDVKDLPPDFGKDIFTGDGAHTITAVSDPFCPHCRKGWEYIKLHQDEIETFRLAHFPLNPASEAACMVMADAHHREFKVFDIVDFAYTSLHSAPEPQKIVVQYMEAFPELAEKWGPDPASALSYLTKTFGSVVRKERKTAQTLGISSTPVFFVNDTYIRGFNAQKMDNAMR